MKHSKILKDISNEYLAIIRDELGWVYLKLSDLDKIRFERELVNINNTLITMLTSTLTKKQITQEIKSMNEIIEIFKMSRN